MAAPGFQQGTVSGAKEAGDTRKHAGALMSRHRTASVNSPRALQDVDKHASFPLLALCVNPLSHLTLCLQGRPPFITHVNVHVRHFDTLSGGTSDGVSCLHVGFAVSHTFLHVCQCGIHGCVCVYHQTRFPPRASSDCFPYLPYLGN